MRKAREGTYADITVIERRRIRVLFNERTTTSSILRKLEAGDFDDITDEDHYNFLDVETVEWLGDEEDGGRKGEWATKKP